MKFIVKFWDDNKFPLTAFLFWRICLLLVGYLVSGILPFKHSFPYIESLSSSLPFSWLWGWGNFDGVYYLRIAQKGYELGEQTFFPVYPLLIRLFHFPFNNYLLSALFVSNLCTLIAGVLLYRLAIKTYQQATVARWVVLIFYAFPTSFFFGAAYPESLLLLLILTAFMTSGLLSFIVSFFAGGTKVVGALLSLVALVFSRRLIPIIGCVLGLMSYMVYLFYAYGDPLSFLTAQRYFNNNRAASLASLVSLPQVVYRYIKILFSTDPLSTGFLIALAEASFLILALAILLKVTLKKGHYNLAPAWIIFSWAALLLPTLTGTLQSLPRYLLPLFPIFLYLGQINNRVIKYCVLFVSLALETIFVSLFLRGYFIS